MQNNVATLHDEETELKERIVRYVADFSLLEDEQQRLQSAIAENRAICLENKTTYKNTQIEHENELKDISNQIQLVQEENLKKRDEINEELETFTTETDVLLASAMNDYKKKSKELKEDLDKVTLKIKDLEAQINKFTEQQENLSQKHDELVTSIYNFKLKIPKPKSILRTLPRSVDYSTDEETENTENAFRKRKYGNIA